MRKELGKITKVKFGLVGYQDANLGLSLTFSFGGCMTSTAIGFWDNNMIECTNNCQWTEEDRKQAHYETMEKISDLLSDCKIDDVSKLKDKPVELTFDGNLLKDWRILTEVL